MELYLGVTTLVVLEIWVMSNMLESCLKSVSDSKSEDLKSLSSSKSTELKPFFSSKNI